MIPTPIFNFQNNSFSQQLGEDKIILHKRREVLKTSVQQSQQQYEAIKAQLNDNETYTQVCVLNL